MKKRILIIDDELAIRKSIKEVLEYEDYLIETVDGGKVGLDKIKSEVFDLILCDIKMQEVDGLEVLKEVVDADIEVPLIMISGHGDIEVAVECIKMGAYDFLTKPIDLNRLLISVRNALEKKELVQEAEILKKKVKKYTGSDIIGESDSVGQVKEMIFKVAPTEARVLIVGENGTGKELVANNLHKQSQRSSGPFVEVNCAAIPSELIESELFGHEKGAFTSAIKQKKGVFELAQNGTLFLDEIGDMSLSAQAKVLRALQEKKITRVGGERDISVNVRILAATNKNLKQMIIDKQFREDLYHRLAVVIIHVPKLNDRLEDIELLCNYFINQICDSYGMQSKTIDKEAINRLKKINWTGNIRELRNVIERLIIFSDKSISIEHINKYLHPVIS